jgi:hypothetical protein
LSLRSPVFEPRLIFGCSWRFSAPEHHEIHDDENEMNGTKADTAAGTG